MAYSRLSVEGAKLFATYNPASPMHWFKKQVVDHIDNFDAYLYEFFLEDNPSLGELYKQRMRSAYTGHVHQRLIEGQWAGANGLIFPEWYKEHRPHDHAPGQWHVSLDYASAGTFHALLIKQYKHYDYSGVVDEFVYNARETGVTRTDDQHADELHKWVKSYVKDPRIRVWLDPSAPITFKRLLRRKGFLLRNADNNVVPGLVSTAGALKRKNVVISDKCQKLQEEMYNYMWDAESEEDKPIKRDDHGCDALRYYCHTHVSSRIHGKKTKVKDILNGNQKSKRNITR